MLQLPEIPHQAPELSFPGFSTEPRDRRLEDALMRTNEGRLLILGSPKDKQVAFTAILSEINATAS